MDLGLAGKAALVTGASRGIGLSIARALAAEGASVAMVARGADALDRAAREIAAHGGEIRSLAVDVATAAGAERAVTWAAAELGALDVLVNNVGGSLGSGMFDDASAEQWSRVLDLNLMSAVWCSQHATRLMRAQGGGVIVHISSICGIEYCMSAAYTAAKAAIRGLTKEMGTDLAKHGIRVVTVAPGSTMFEGSSWDRRKATHPELVEHLLKHDLPWKRFGTPEEIANVVAFVASARASWITGTTVVVDGGQMRAV